MKSELLKLWKDYLNFLSRDPDPQNFRPSFEGFMAWIEQAEENGKR